MGESLVETPTVEEKMGESMTLVPCLQESVSFGRFEHDSLCWERWSTFPTNKYLEEVEKCSTPGSVAQKRAYFEAHYKRIAARKAELLDQEKKRENESLNSEDQSQNLMDSVCNFDEEELEVEKSNTPNPVCGTEVEKNLTDFAEEVSDVHIDVPIDGVGFVDEENKVANLTGEVSDAHIDVPSDGTSTIIEENEVATFETEVSEHIDEPNDCAEVIEEKHIQPQPEVADEDLCSEEKSIELKPTEPDFVKEEVASTLASQDREEDIPQGKVEEREMVKKENEDVVIVETPKNMRKVTSKTMYSTNAKKKTVTPMSKGSAARMPKKLATPTPKSPMLSTPKLSKPVQSKTLMSATRSSAKKENGFTPQSTKKAARSESKRIVPTSLHMSLSLGPANSDPAALTTRRKSLIMESMGDKDIVKRAFKAFEKCNLLSSASLSRSPATNQPVTKKIEHKGSGPGTFQKKNEVISRSVKAAGPCSGRQGAVKASLSPGLRKATGMDQRNGKSTPFFGSRSLNLGNKQKEVSKKLEQKSITKETGKPHLPSKATLEKAVEIRRPSQSTNSKANLSSSCNQGRVSKVLLKEDTKTKASG